MTVRRSIGNVSLEINVNEANEVFLEEDVASTITQDGISGIINAIYQHNESTHIPLSVFIELTNACNFNCPFCYINESNIKKTYMPRWDDFQSELDDLIELGMIYCTISGGECLIHPDFETIYKYLKQKGVLVSVFTNGYLMNENTIRLFKEFKPFKIEISLYGDNDKSYSDTTMTVGIDSGKIYDNIIKLSESGINVVCKTPINRLTEYIWESNKNWCEEHNIDYYYGFEMLKTYSNKSTDNFKASEELLKKLKADDDKKFKESLDMYILSHKEKQFKKKFDCTAGRTDLFISATNILYPCMKAIYSKDWGFDINTLGIKNAYNAYIEKLTPIKDQVLEGCIGCSHHEVCQECFFTQLGINTDVEKRKTYCASLKAFCDYAKPLSDNQNSNS